MGWLSDAWDAVTGFVEDVVDFVVDVVETVVDFVGDVVDFVVNPMGVFDQPDQPDPGQAAQGVTVSKQGTTNGIPVVYGYRRVGGSIIFAESNGESNKYLYIVYAICEGEIHGVHKLIVNDVELPTQGSVHTHGTVYNVSDGRFKDRMKYQIFNGQESQAQSSLGNETPTWPKKRRRLPGIAYAVCRFEWKEATTQEEADQNPYSGGIPQVKFDVYGKKVYDVRSHGSGVELSSSYSSRSKAYSFNPANCLLDYLENPRYGAGLDISEINAQSFKIAANKYEQTVDYSNSQSGRAMTMNAVIETKNKILDNVKTLVGGCRGLMPFVQGRYKLKVEDGGHPTDITSSTVNIAYDVDKDNIIGSVTLTGESKTSKYNQVIINYIDPDLAFSNQQVVKREDGDQTIDNEEELSGEFTFHTLTNPAIARDLAEMIYKKSRTQRSISFTATQELLDVEIGDIIRFTDPVLDLDLQTFRVVSMKLKINGQVAIDAVEHDATIYPFTKGDQIEIPPSLYTPDDYQIVPYVKPLPVFPTSIYPPLDPDYDSAGQPVEVNAPPNSPDANLLITGITKFEDFTKSYPPSSSRAIWQGTLPDGTFYLFGYTITVFTKFFFLADGKGCLAMYTNPDYYTNELYPIDYYHMARPYNNNPGKFQMDLIMPLDPRMDRLIVRAFYQGNKVFEQIEEVRDPSFKPSATYPSLANPNKLQRVDPYTGILHLRYPMELDMSQGNKNWVWTARWASKRTGEEWEDGSDFSAAGFTNWGWRNSAGIAIQKGNLEAYLNYVHYYYWSVREVARIESLFASSDLGG